MTQGIGIGELSEGTGTPISTIRFYERKGLLPPPPRVSGKRRYPEAALHRVRLVRMWQEGGFSLGEIAQLLADRADLDGWKALVRTKIAELEQRQVEVEHARQQLEHSLLCKAPDWTTCPTMQALALSARSGRMGRVEPPTS